MSNIVFYHANCMDGFCSAWMFKRNVPEESEFIPINYGSPFEPESVKDRSVYILDFSFKPDVMEKIIENATNVVLLDHHETAEKDLKKFIGTGPKSQVIFDMTKSGAKLTTEYCGNKGNWIVDYVEDRDLWRFALPSSKEVNVALQSYPMDFKVWDSIFIGASKESMALEGIAILRYQNNLIERAMANKHDITIKGKKGLSVNSCLLQSEIGEKLAEESGTYGHVWYENGKVTRNSLRSQGDYDVGKIAKSLGGGGHRNSSGYESHGRSF